MSIKSNAPLVGVVPHNGKFYALTQNFGAYEFRDGQDNILVIEEE